MTRNRLYLLLSAGLLAGYGWAAWALLQQEKHNTFTPCMFKNVTGIACPSCGTTRSLLSLARGNFTEAFLINPLGLLLAGMLIITPLWMTYDVITQKSTLYKSYKNFEETLTIKWVAIIFVLLIVCNWAWNIHKGL